MSNTPLQVMRQLADLHRTATTRMFGDTYTGDRTAHEEMADGLHKAIMGIAGGNDPYVEVESLRDVWLSSAELADGRVASVFATWAGSLRREVLA